MRGDRIRKRLLDRIQSAFPGLDFSKHGQFLIGQGQNTMVLLTDHFTARTMNGKLDEVVDLMREELVKNISNE